MADFESKVVTVALGTYEGGLLVYRVDLDREIHLGSFSSKDSVVKSISTRDYSRLCFSRARLFTREAEMRRLESTTLQKSSKKVPLQHKMVSAHSQRYHRKNPGAGKLLVCRF